jgi:hypothetical protein
MTFHEQLVNIDSSDISRGKFKVYAPVVQKVVPVALILLDEYVKYIS